MPKCSEAELGPGVCWTKDTVTVFSHLAVGFALKRRREREGESGVGGPGSSLIRGLVETPEARVSNGLATFRWIETWSGGGRRSGAGIRLDGRVPLTSDDGLKSTARTSRV